MRREAHLGLSLGDKNTGTIIENKDSVPWKVVEKELGGWVLTRTFSSCDFSQAG